MRPYHTDDTWIQKLNTLRSHAGIHTTHLIITPHIDHQGDVITFDRLSDIQTLRRICKQQSSGIYSPRQPADAIVVSAQQMTFAFFMATADSPAIVFYGRNKKGSPVVAFAQASLQALLHNVIKKTVESMQKLGCEPRYIEANTLPGIAKCCYGVNDELFKTIRKKMHGRIFSNDRKRSIDQVPLTCTKGPRIGLPAINVQQAISQLIEKSGVPFPGLRNYFCTSCSETNYFSHVHGDTGRNGMFVVFKPL